MGLFKLFNKKKDLEPVLERPDINKTILNVTLSNGPYFLKTKTYSFYSIEIVNQDGNGIAFVPRLMTHDYKCLLDIYRDDIGKQIAERSVKILIVENDPDFPIPNARMSFRDVDSDEKQSVVYTANANYTKIEVYYIEENELDDYPVDTVYLLLMNNTDYSGYKTYNDVRWQRE